MVYRYVTNVVYVQSTSAGHFGNFFQREWRTIYVLWGRS